MSPYQYASNDPIKNIDVNGDSTWIANGTLHMTGVVFDDTGDMTKKQVRKKARQLTNDLTSKLKASFKEAGIDLDVDIQIGAADKKEDIKNSDHLFAIQDNPVDEEGNQIGGGVATYRNNKTGERGFGKTAMLNSSNGNLRKNMVHEAGHMLGLLDFLNSSGQISERSRNPMAYPNDYLWTLFRYDQRSGDFNANQAREIKSAVEGGHTNIMGSKDVEIRMSLGKGKGNE